LARRAAILFVLWITADIGGTTQQDNSSLINETFTDKSIEEKFAREETYEEEKKAYMP
jgi:hypothetical protein